VPKEGDLLVLDVEDPDATDHVRVFVSLTNVSTDIIECTGNEAYERCIERTLSQNYGQLLTAGYRPVSVRALVDPPATIFLDARAVSQGVEWTTLFLRNTWGFAVEWSADGVGSEQIGDYMLLEDGDDDQARTFSWSGPLPEGGYVRVVEIEAQSQRLTASRWVAQL
jgi:hypothetical protein